VLIKKNTYIYVLKVLTPVIGDSRLVNTLNDEISVEIQTVELVQREN